VIGVVDIGNTLTKCARFGAQGELLAEFSFPTAEGIPAGARDFFSTRVERAVVGSVVPSCNGPWLEFLGAGAHLASAESPWGFALGVEEPAKVGVDRLANLEGALGFSGSVVVVDAGTATKFDLLEGVGKRSFPGGAIAPGVEISFEALLARTAQLPRIELKKHSPVVGYNTETAIRSGVVHGFASLVDGMLLRLFEERKLPPSTAVISTGGFSNLLEGRSRLITQRRPRLTLEGLHAIARKI
jgi:pantothenate kinase type III